MKPLLRNVKDRLTKGSANLKYVFLLQDFQLNRVVMEEGAGAEPSPAGARPKKKNRKTYDLTAADKFWQKHKGRSVLLLESLRKIL